MIERACGSCGGQLRNARAYLNGRPFCDTCYCREFKSAACASCGASYRRHISDVVTTLCRKCRPKEHCIRCQKVANNHSFRTHDGPVCSYCRRFFEEPKLCTNCGKPSRHLARRYSIGFDTPVCPTCWAKGHEVCARCLRPRKVVARRANGQPLCKACEADEVYVCPVCNQTGTPHSKNKCRDCYFREHALRHAQKLSNELFQQWVKNNWNDFVNSWVPISRPTGANTTHLTRFFAFFKKIDGHIKHPDELNTERLIRLFGPDSVQTYAKGFNFLIETKRISPIATDFLNRYRGENEQTKLLARVSSPWKKELLVRYLAHLKLVSDVWRKRGWNGKHERHAPRTVTLLTRAAWKFLESLPEEVCAVHAISGESLDRFIVFQPGHKNALHSFINYLNRFENLFQKLNIRKNKSTKNRSKHILPESKSDALLQRWLHPSDRELRNALIGLFMLVYARSAKQVVHLYRGDFTIAMGGKVTVKFGKTAVALDTEIAKLLRRYLENLEISRGYQLNMDDFIFPGRVANRSLSESSVTYFLGRYDVTAENLFSTALANFYRNGLTRPKILTRTLGVSTETALAYFEIFAPRVTEEMAQNAVKR